MRRLYEFFLIAVLVLVAARFLTGCGKFSMGEGAAPYYIESYNMDGTKMIVDGSQNQNDPSTYSQDHYTIKSGARLLIRFESLSKHVDEIKQSYDNELHLRLVPTDRNDARSLRGAVMLCPLTKNWMMLATWYKAHPFSKEGSWTTPGGDYDAGSCIRGEIQNPDGTNPDASPSPSPSPMASANGPIDFRDKPLDDDQRLPQYRTEKSKSVTPDASLIDRPSVIFDIKHWFQSNPEGRSLNYGFIVISETPVEVFGDKSDAYSPRLYWKAPKDWTTTPGGSGSRGGKFRY